MTQNSLTQLRQQREFDRWTHEAALALVNFRTIWLRFVRDYL